MLKNMFLNMYNYLHAVPRKIWYLFNPIIFIHSADLMLPYSESFYSESNGFTTLQLKIIMLMNELENITHDSDNRKIENSFLSFTSFIDNNGFDYNHSFIQIVCKPFIRIEEGSHRLGYLLSNNTNSFIPVRVLPPWNIGYFSEDGYNYFSHKEIMEYSKFQFYIEKYKAYIGGLRKYLTAIFDANLFNNNSKDILSNISELGDVEIVGNTELFYQRQFRHHTGIKIKPNQLFVVIHVTINHNKLSYHSIGRLKLFSKCVNCIINTLNNKYGNGWGYIAQSITESVYLDTLINPISANSKKRI